MGAIGQGHTGGEVCSGTAAIAAANARVAGAATAAGAVAEAASLGFKYRGCQNELNAVVAGTKVRHTVLAGLGAGAGSALTRC